MKILLTIGLIVLSVLGFLSLFALGFSIFGDLKRNTTSISNVGFLMLLGLSNVCFSWARIYTSESKSYNASLINEAAIAFISGALFFALGSLSKYLLITEQAEHLVLPLLSRIPKMEDVLSISTSISFWGASFSACTAIVNVLIVLWDERFKKD